MTTQRIWIDDWQWQCCGGSLRVGDDVTLTVEHGVTPWLIEHLGAELAASVSAVETHHDDEGEPPTDLPTLSGTITAIQSVVFETEEREVPIIVEDPRLIDHIGGALFPAPATQKIVEALPDSAHLQAAPQVPWIALAGMDEEEPEGFLVDLEIR